MGCGVGGWEDDREARRRRPLVARQEAGCISTSTVTSSRTRCCGWAWEFFGRLYFDTITHDARALRYLVERVGLDNVVLGAPTCPSTWRWTSRWPPWPMRSPRRRSGRWRSPTPGGSSGWADLVSCLAGSAGAVRLN